VRPKKENPVFLVLDGHSAHTRNMQLLHAAPENILCSGDRVVAKIDYNQQIADLIGKAYFKAASAGVTVNGFRGRSPPLY
jgi:hypothetical protein